MTVNPPALRSEVETAGNSRFCNTTTALAQEAPTATLLSDGGFVVLFESEPVNDAGFEIRSEQLPVPANGNNGVVVPMSRRLELTQLTERTCKWPIGDPLNDDFHFCGNESPDNSPYCTYHQRLAYQPSAERRRMR